MTDTSQYMSPVYMGKTESTPQQKLDWKYRAGVRLHVSMVKDLPWPVILGRDWVGYSTLMWEGPEQRPRTESLWAQLGNEAEGLGAMVRRPQKRAQRPDQNTPDVRDLLRKCQQESDGANISRENIISQLVWIEQELARVQALQEVLAQAQREMDQRAQQETTETQTETWAQKNMKGTQTEYCGNSG